MDYVVRDHVVYDGVCVQLVKQQILPCHAFYNSIQTLTRNS